MNVSAVLVTRGDVDLRPALEPLQRVFDDVIVYDNSRRENLGVYGRYAAIAEAKHDWIYTQDDDAITPAAAICTRRRRGTLVANVPLDEEFPWIAWGSIFPRELPDAPLAAYRDIYGDDALFYRWPDVIFAESVRVRRVHLGHEDLPWAFGPDRMYRASDHYTSQAEARARVAALREAVAA